MRSIGTLAVITGMLVLASGCSDGAGTPPPDNTAPVANFGVPACIINVPCDFTSTSTDDAQVTEWSWDFDGDGNADANAAKASFTYTTAAAFNVSLAVRDAQGLSDTKTSSITIAPPVNTPPTAGFTHTCNAADCTFTSTSTDPAPGTIATYAWTFGDGGTADGNNPSHSYSVTAPTDFTVTLTVTDNDGATDVETQTVSVSPPANTPPTAGFTRWCVAEDCIFTSTSTDLAPGTIATYAWTFGDGGTADWKAPGHSYVITAPMTFTVALTVTDNEGLTAVATQKVTLTPRPPAVEGCTTSDNIVECVFDIPARSTLKVKLLGIDCDLGRVPASRIIAPPPIGDQIFLGVCWRTAGQEIGIFGGKLDELIVYEAGTQARIWFIQGVPNPNDPILAPPAGRMVGTFPDWTISIEDGAHSTREGEPDFTDVVFGVHATLR